MNKKEFSDNILNKIIDLEKYNLIRETVFTNKLTEYILFKNNHHTLYVHFEMQDWTLTYYLYVLIKDHLNNRVRYECLDLLDLDYLLKFKLNNKEELLTNIFHSIDLNFWYTVFLLKIDCIKYREIIKKLLSKKE